jgi:uncharacterized protein YjiS (DUF1127 family)|tara:strand:+ start:436 stop:579 length:144 start_codon:yes stop_codon:yes gene_type:complete
MLKKLWRRAVAAQERRANYWKLQNMTDKELRDIGVERFEINKRIYKQ